MGRPLLHFFACAAFWSLHCVFAVPNQAQEPPAPQAESQLENEIGRLIKQLGSDSFEEREEAQRKLMKIGLPAQKLLREARSSEEREIALRAANILAEFDKQELAASEVHVVGLYESRGGKAIVEVREPKSKKPLILVLCAYESVTWSIKGAENVKILRVIASGYHRQIVEGVNVPISTYSYDERSPGAGGQLFYFYTYDHDEETYPDMVDKVRQLTGNKISSFQGRYSFKKVPFVIGGDE